jgi:hypothetical protein
MIEFGHRCSFDCYLGTLEIKCNDETDLPMAPMVGGDGIQKGHPVGGLSLLEKHKAPRPRNPKGLGNVSSTSGLG